MTYSTDDLAKAARTTLRGIRLWENNGLFGPVSRDMRGDRVFTEAHVNTAKIIAAAQMAGFTLKEIKAGINRPINFASKIHEAEEFMSDVRRALFGGYGL